MITDHKNYDESSVFTPENLLREARRQKNIATGKVPDVCVLDPDGDLVDYLIRTHQAILNKSWAGYHTKLYNVKHNNDKFGILGCAVGASFAVLIAEQLFVSGCQTLISITSAGIIKRLKNKPQFILIKQALRDEGTSYHYIHPSQPSIIQKDLYEKVMQEFIVSNYQDKFPEGVKQLAEWLNEGKLKYTETVIDGFDHITKAFLELFEGRNKGKMIVNI